LRETLPLVVAVLVLQRDLVFRGRVLFDRDVEHFLYERLAVMAAAVRAGSWPLWNPYPAFGEPLLAIANLQLAYPTSWLAIVLPPEITDSVTVVFHTLLAGLGTWALARELGLSNRAALTAGILWSYSGAYLSAVNQANVLIGATYIPWGWMAWARWGRTGRPAAAVGAGLAVGLCLLGGSPESAIMAMAGVLFAARRHDVRATVARLGRAVALALVVGLGLSAVQWLPTASIIPRSVRAHLTRADKDVWSNHPARLAQLVLPLPVEHLPLRDDIRAAMFNEREPLLYSIYVGLGMSSLAALALLGPRRRARGLVASLAAGAFVLSLGPHGLLWTAVREIPPLSLVRFPERFGIAGTVALTVLAGMGVDALADVVDTGRRRAQVLFAALVASCAVALTLFARLPSPLWRALLTDERTLGWRWSSSPTIRAAAGHMILAALLALMMALVIVLRAAGWGRRFLPVAAAAVAVLDPLVALRDLNPTVPRAVLREPNPAFAPFPRERPNRTFLPSYDGSLASRLLHRPTATEHPFDATPEQRLWNDRYYPSTSLGTPGWNIESVPGDVTALRDATVARWINTLHALESTPAFPRLLALSGISCVIALHDLGPSGFTLLGMTPGRHEAVRTFRVPGTLPRAFAVGGLRVAEGQAAFQQLLDPGFDPRREVVLGAGTPAPAGDAGTVRIAHLGFDRVSLEADMAQPGYVVLLESWAPEWRASVDGTAAPLLRANLIFRAVPVPAGRHRIEMSYRSLAAALGLGLSLVTLTALALAAGRAWRRRPGDAIIAP
jgi:hypothetical protein